MMQLEVNTMMLYNIFHKKFHHLRPENYYPRFKDLYYEVISIKYIKLFNNI